MKNKKFSILFEGMRRINDQRKNIVKIDSQGTIKVTFESGQSIVTTTAVQINRLQGLFPQIKLQQVINDFTEYLTLPSQILGKRSSKIILSKSSRYCLKIVEQQDICEIKNILQSLFNRFKDDKTNCLVKLYFIFVIDYTVAGVKLTDRYILMPNIRGSFDRCIKTFDIKGHLQARMINNDDFIDFKFGKDENFVQSDELCFLKDNLKQQKLQQIIEQIQNNVQFLTNNNLIDYSLLFSIQKLQQHQDNIIHSYPCPQIKIDNHQVLKWVIIDYFQIYNDKKKLEGRFKSIFRKTFSSVEPQVYSQRLIDFLKKYLLN